jgi:hypothetical protein
VIAQNLNTIELGSYTMAITVSCGTSQMKSRENLSINNCDFLGKGLLSDFAVKWGQRKKPKETG